MPLSGQVLFSTNHTWQMRDKSPWKVVGQKIELKNPLPGRCAGGSVAFEAVDNFVVECNVAMSGQLTQFKLFGQQIGVFKGSKHVRIMVIGGKEHVQYNGGSLKKASKVDTQFSVMYHRGSTASVTISNIRFKSIGDRQIKHLRRIYKL
jgi:hypothetical protein